MREEGGGGLPGIGEEGRGELTGKGVCGLYLVKPPPESDGFVRFNKVCQDKGFVKINV